MAKSKKLTDEELFAQFEGIGDDGAAKAGTESATGKQQSDADLLEELSIPERPKPSSRPHTPRVASTSTTPAVKSSPKQSGTGATPSNDGARSSEEKARLRKSGDSSRSFHNSFTPASTEEAEPEAGKSASILPEAVQASSSGGWWGAITATASAAVKQAENLAKEIKQNEEAQRWAEQVKGNVGTLRGLGTPGAPYPFKQCFSDNE